MTAITSNARVTAATKLRELARALREAIDAFAAYRIQHAVPELELRRAAREVARYRGMIQARPNTRG
jgi:hypothetical protein